MEITFEDIGPNRPGEALSLHRASQKENVGSSLTERLKHSEYRLEIILFDRHQDSFRKVELARGPNYAIKYPRRGPELAEMISRITERFDEVEKVLHTRPKRHSVVINGAMVTDTLIQIYLHEDGLGVKPQLPSNFATS